MNVSGSGKARPLRLYMVAGEASGDAHSAGLARCLLARRPDAVVSGLGGPQLREIAGDEVEDWVDRAAVVGLVEVLRHYGYFRKKMAEAVSAVEAGHPDAVVLVDYPGFNLRLARTLRLRGYEGSIIYYISPQVWAWRRSRIPKMTQWLDLMICIFPFEEELDPQAGLRAVFVGHPMADRMEGVSRVERLPDLVGFFPGSREREVARLFPLMLEAGRLLARKRPELRFVAAAASPKLAAEMGRLIAEQPGSPPVEVVQGKALRLMQEATVGVVASGTATLEAAFLGLPYCLVYRVAWPTYVAGRAVIRVPYLGIVNLLAGRELVREFLQSAARPEAVAEELERLLDDSVGRAALQDALRRVTGRLGGKGSYERAAEAVLGLVVPGENTVAFAARTFRLRQGASDEYIPPVDL